MGNHMQTRQTRLLNSMLICSSYSPPYSLHLCLVCHCLPVAFLFSRSLCVYKMQFVLCHNPHQITCSIPVSKTKYNPFFGQYGTPMFSYHWKTPCSSQPCRNASCENRLLFPLVAWQVYSSITPANPRANASSSPTGISSCALFNQTNDLYITVSPWNISGSYIEFATLQWRKLI